MAEFIPTEYRLRTEQRYQVSRWISFGVICALCAVTVLTYTFLWYHRRSSENDTLGQEFKAKSALIVRSQELRSRRQALAHRMEKIQELMDDKVLASLLQHISEGFDGDNCILEYINIDARVQDPPAPNKPASDPRYVVRITGITRDSGTLAELMTRLGKRTNPPINVVLESSHREPLLDGQAMRFQIVCEKNDTRGT